MFKDVTALFPKRMSYIGVNIIISDINTAKKLYSSKTLLDLVSFLGHVDDLEGIAFLWVIYQNLKSFQL